MLDSQIGAPPTSCFPTSASGAAPIREAWFACNVHAAAQQRLPADADLAALDPRS